MALTKCHECGEQVSSKADTCPNCGVKNPGGSWFNYTGTGCSGGGCLTVIVGLVFLFIMFGDLGSSGSFESSSPSADYTSPGRSTSSPQASVSQVEIRGFNNHVDEVGDLHISGEVVNNNSVPVGVQVQLILRDGNGNVVHSDEFWPASVRNIPAGGSEPIDWIITDDYVVSRTERLNIKPVQVNQW